MKHRTFPYQQLQPIFSFIKAKPIEKIALSDYFYDKVSFFEKFGQDDYDVVFIGDSLVDGADWEDLFPTLKIANRGINGDRTDGVLMRLDSIFSTNAKKVFIMLGTNDISSGVKLSSVIENYSLIIHQLVSHGLQVYVQSTILSGSQRKDLTKNVSEINAEIIVLNENLKKIADKTQLATYIDLNIGLVKNSYLDPIYSRDNIHLNASGYFEWKKIIENYIY